MLVSDKYKFIYYHLYKTGGRAITKMLQQSDRTVRHYAHVHAHIRWGERLIGSVEDGWKDKGVKDNDIIISIRNPFDWIVSLYLHMHRSPRHPLGPFSACLNFEQFVIFYQEILTKDFLGTEKQMMMAGQDRLLRHLLPSEFYQSGNPIYYTIRQESLYEDVCKLCKIKGMPRPEEKIVGKRNRKHYREYYTPELRQRVTKLFQHELNIWGYSF